MILGNKCDMEDKRQVPKEKGETVSQTRTSGNITKLLLQQLFESKLS